MQAYLLLKKLIYIVEAVLGVCFVLLANSLITDGSPVSWLVAMILYSTGLMCMVFGATTYKLRNDPDIWR
jgi:peptidoglycan/LPS O-acetylase OafA/YrhL